MKKFFTSLIFIFCTSFLFAQTADLVVTNNTNQPMFIWAGASNGCNGPGAVATLWTSL